MMKKLSKRQKFIILTSLITVLVIIVIVIGVNVIRVNITNSSYNSSNSDSNNGNLLPEYIKEGITLGGVTGTLEDLDTSDATAKPEDILWGKTAYVDGKKITGTYLTLGMLEVGDYVDYKPDVVNSYPLSSTYSGCSSDQTISQENLSWRILNINDDGTVDLVSSAPTSQTIYFEGALGYNNGVYLLNDIATKLYSNSNLGVTARSLTIEDIEAGMTEEGLEYVHSYTDNGVTYGDTVTYTDYIYYPHIYSYENGSGIDTTTIKSNGVDKSDNYYTSPTTQTYLQANTSLTVTQTYYYRSMSDNYFKNSEFYNLLYSNGAYWLSSRCVYTNSSYAYYGISSIGSSYARGLLFRSDNHTFSSFYGLRPIVSFSSNVQVDGGDGTQEHPYTLKGI